MIPLTRLNGDNIAINPDRIERADVTPDVVLTMTDGSKYVIAESLDELIDRIRLFRASIVALSQDLVLHREADQSTPLRLVSDGLVPGTLADSITDAVTHHAVDARAIHTSADSTAVTPPLRDAVDGGDESTTVPGA